MIGMLVDTCRQRRPSRLSRRTPAGRTVRCSAHRELPRSDVVAHPPRLMLHRLRPLARWVFRLRFKVRMHGTEHVPVAGPVILASNHVGLADGPLLAIFAPRPVHALTKVEMFRGLFGRFLLASGLIPLDRFQVDTRAVKLCLRVLRDDGVLGIFPEGRRGSGDFERFHLGAAYLALVSGAPVVPVIQIGTRDRGAGMNGVPRRGSVVDLVFGEPYLVAKQPWPRTHDEVVAESARLQHHLVGALDAALALTDRELPGELPPHQLEADPATTIEDQPSPGQATS